MKAQYALIVVAVSLAACSQSERYPAGPSSLTSSATHSTADDTPTNLSQYDEPDEPPRGWTFDLQGDPRADGSRSVFFALTPIQAKTGLVGKYEIGCEVYPVTNVWTAVQSQFINLPAKMQGEIPLGTRIRCHARSVFGNAHQGHWTNFIERTNGWPEVNAVPNTPAEECWWEETGLQFFRLVFGRR
jgi:hypothetical protein